MRKYIPYIVIATIIAIILAVVSYIISPQNIEIWEIIVINAVLIIAYVLALCGIGKMLSEKEIFLEKFKNKIKDE